MHHSPLPPMGEDPAVRGAQLHRAAYTNHLRSIRSNQSLDNLTAAQMVVDLHAATNRQLADAYRDLQQRRQDRLDTLGQIAPFGPPPTADISPGDAEQIHAAFRNAHTEAAVAARNLNTGPTAAGDTIASTRPTSTTLEGMLADAERFGDDTRVRAILTAAHDAGRSDIIDAWAANNGITDQLTEARQLHDDIAGYGLAGHWYLTTFAPLPEPDEARQLPLLIAASDKARQQQIRQTGLGHRAYPN